MSRTLTGTTHLLRHRVLHPTFGASRLAAVRRQLAVGRRQSAVNERCTRCRSLGDNNERKGPSTTSPAYNGPIRVI